MAADRARRGELAGPPAKELTRKEAQALVDAAFELERKIKTAARDFHTSWWELAEALYTFHEEGSWKLLDYDSLDAFLAQPDLGISRAHFFRMTKMWRDLVITKGIAPATLHAIEPSKAREVVPAIMRGEVKPSDALADATELSYSDVRFKYRPEERAKHGQKPERLDQAGRRRRAALDPMRGLRLLVHAGAAARRR